jgi:hypothetical protein
MGASLEAIQRVARQELASVKDHSRTHLYLGCSNRTPTSAVEFMMHLNEDSLADSDIDGSLPIHGACLDWLGPGNSLDVGRG